MFCELLLFLTVSSIVGHLNTSESNKGAGKSPRRKRGTPSKFKKVASPQFHRDLLRQNDQALPTADLLAHKLGICAIVTSCVPKKSKTGEPEAIYAAPIHNSIRDKADPLKMRELANIACMATLRNADGTPMKIKDGSDYNWMAPIIFNPTGNVTMGVAMEYLQTYVREHNMHGVNTALFDYKSEVRVNLVKGDLNDPPTIDQTIIDSDVILIMKALYGIETNEDLLEVREEDKILLEFFSTTERGVEAINNFVNKPSYRRGVFAKNK